MHSNGNEYLTLGSGDYIGVFSGEVLQSDTKTCVEDQDVISVSRKPSMELNCKKSGDEKLQKKWTTNTKFNTYQECSGRKGYRLIRKCPPNSVFWNILQCCVNLMDFPCKSNCIKPIKKCVNQ